MWSGETLFHQQCYDQKMLGMLDYLSKEEEGEIKPRKGHAILETRVGIERIKVNGILHKILMMLDNNKGELPEDFLVDRLCLDEGYSSLRNDYIKNAFNRLERLDCVERRWGRCMMVTADGSSESNATTIIKLKEHRLTYDVDLFTTQGKKDDTGKI